MPSTPSTQYTYMRIMRQANNPGNLLYLTEINLSNGALPVELISFNAKSINENVILNWKTATETNNYGFELQMSYNQNDWSFVSFIHGNGTISSEKSYSYTMPITRIVSNHAYFRLKQIDRDGTFEYSKVVSVVIDHKVSKIMVSPNPMNTSSTIFYDLAHDSNVMIYVYNESGVVVQTIYEGYAKQGINITSLNISNLVRGTYFINIVVDGSHMMTKKIVAM